MYLKKFENGTEQEFKSLAEDPITGNFGKTYVRNSVMWATYLGYPGNKGVCNNESFLERAINFYGIPDKYAEDAVHLATQMAVWLFTDYNTALSKFWSPMNADGSLGEGSWDRIEICNKYDPKSMGDPITYLAADIAKQAYDKSSSAPEDMVLDLYIPWSKENIGHKQNLLVTHYTKMEINRTPVKVTLDVQKKMDNDRKVKDKEFSFAFTGKDSQREYNETVYNMADGKVAIPELTFTEPGVYEFYIQENVGTDPNVEYQNGKHQIFVTVEGTKNLTAKVSYGNSNEKQLVIVNKVKAPKNGQLKINKIVEGEGASPDLQFSFTVALKDENGAPVSGTFGGYTFIEGIAKIQVSQNKPVVIKELPAGTQYTVTEDPLPEEGEYQLASANNIEGAIQPDTTAEVSFLNTVKPKPLYGDLKISKTLNVAPEGHANDHFRFTIKLDDPSADLSKVNGAAFVNGEAEVSVAAGGSIVISGLPAGIGYTVTEHVPDGYAMASTGAVGNIVANQQVDANFVNTYLNTGELTIQKIISGFGAANSDVFNFKITLSNENGLLPDAACTIKSSDGTTKPAQITNGELEVSIAGNDFVTIMDLPVGATYDVAEKQPDGSFTSTEGNIVENGYKLMNVTGNGQSTAADKTMKVVFTNSKYMETGYLQVFKGIEGGNSSTNDEFVFRIVLKKFDGTPLSGVYTDQNGQKVSFDSLGKTVVAIKGGTSPLMPFVQINGLPVGTQFSVEEFTGIPGKYTAAPGTIVQDGYTLKSIEGSASGTISAGKNGVAFINRKANTSLTVQKTIAGQIWTDEVFTFEITLTGDGAKFSGERSGVAFENGFARVTIQGAGSKTIIGLPECGYTVNEKPVEGWKIPGEKTGVLADGSAATASFENVKEIVEPVSVSLQARKTLDGKVPEGGQFAFVLKDSSGKILDIQGNDADGKITFDPQVINTAGVYTYQISEEAGMNTDIKYDAAIYTAVVNVSKNEQDGKLKAQVTYQKGEGEVVSEVLFENKTVAPQTTSVTVKKKWILNDGGKVAPSVTVVLLKNGVAADQVILNEANGWTYKWNDLDARQTWTVDEINVPSGFKHSVATENGVFMIINDDIPKTPDKPDEPEQSKPDKPNETSKPNQPAKSEASQTVSASPKTSDPGRITLLSMMGVACLSGVVLVLTDKKRWNRNNKSKR